MPCDGDLGHLEDNIAAVAHHLRADLDQLVLQTRQRPVLDRLRRRQRAQEIAGVVGERMKLEPHRIGGRSSDWAREQIADPVLALERNPRQVSEILAAMFQAQLGTETEVPFGLADRLTTEATSFPTRSS